MLSLLKHAPTQDKERLRLIGHVSPLAPKSERRAKDWIAGFRKLVDEANLYSADNLIKKVMAPPASRGICELAASGGGLSGDTFDRITTGEARIWKRT